MDKIARISIIADSFDRITWNVTDWKDEHTQLLYKEMINAVEAINRQIIDTNKLLLTSSLELGVDILFSHMAIELEKRLGRGKILTQVAIPYLNQGASYSDINKKRYIEITQNTDLIIFLSDKILAREEIEKSRYWRIDNSDYLIMVSEDRESNKYAKYARERKIPILFIRPEMIKSIVIKRKQIMEYVYPLIFEKSNYAEVVIESARKVISDYSKTLLNLDINFEEDKELTRGDLINKYSELSTKIARASVIFDNFLSEK